MPTSVSYDLLGLSPSKPDGVAHNCEHGEPAASAGHNAQPLAHFEAPTYTRGPSSKKKHTYVWQCVRQHPCPIGCGILTSASAIAAIHP
jgi:hypothetical protein